VINANNYTAKQIEDTLRMKTSSRRASFRYDLLNRQDIKIGTLDGVTKGSVSYGEFRVIKRSANFTLNEYLQRNIDFMNDQIQPWFILHMPDGGTVEWPLGIFLLESPAQTAEGRILARDIGAYDKTIIIEQDKFAARHFIGAGTNYVVAITRILNEAGITKVAIADSPLTLPNDREFAVGTKRLHAINALLGAINHTSIGVDEMGYLRSEPYIEPARRPVTKIYSADKHSIIRPGIRESLDIAGRPNVFIRVSINIESCTELVSTFINDDPRSVISTVRRGRQIVDFGELQDIANQEALDNHVRRIALESMSAFSHLSFSTALMPNHGRAETMLCTFPKLFDGTQKWSETSWEMDLKYDGVMRHEARRANQL